MSRIILHVDMNAFFAAVEQAANPALRGKPIVVGGGIKKGSVVAAASYEARAFGVKSGMASWEAKKLCPQLIVVIGDMSKYVYTSRIITSMLIDYTDLVEVFSIDEAFMDLTGTKDRFGGEVAIAGDIKRRIKERFGITCSIGIGPNKLVAKLAGELQKPDGLVVIREEDFLARVEKVLVKEFCGVGRKLEQYLAQMGIRTIGQLNRYPRLKLIKRFGTACGENLWQMGQGKGSTVVTPYYHEVPAKSMGHSYTLPKFTDDLDEVNGYLLRLCEQVGRRLRRDNYRGNVIHLALGFGNHQYWGRQKKLEDYLDDGFEIFNVAKRLTLHAQRFAQRQTPYAIRFVGISVSNLIHKIDQICIFEEDEKKKDLLKAVDAINDRFGEFTIERAAIMNTILQGKTGMAAPRLYKGGILG